MPTAGPPDADDAERPVRLVLADDDEATRTGIRIMLAPRGFRVAADAANKKDAIGAVIRARPDQCVVATNLPGGGISAATEIHARAPDVAIVMLASVPDEAELFAALEAGAVGYLVKDIAPAALGDALRGVMHGEAAISPRCVGALVREFRARSSAAAYGRIDCLTSRQLLVLELLSTGARTAEIARRLGISSTTVRRHSSEIVARLGVENRDVAIDAYRALRGPTDGPAGA